MSGISSSVGLISGINSAEIIDQLMKLESVQVNQMSNRVSILEIQRTAFMDLAARLLSARNAAASFSKPVFFKEYAAQSSNESVLTATASADALPGTYSFRVHSLVSNHALLSKGFADADRTPVGAGELTIEVGDGRINPGTELDSLNGGDGIQRGSFTITDRSGRSATIDLSTAVTVSDVLDAINTAGLNVRAAVTGIEQNGATGDRLVLTDTTATNDVVGNLIVQDESGQHTAADLGIVGDVAAGRLDGQDLVYLTMDTPLSLLNDGNGVGRLYQGADLHFATSNGDFDVSFTDLLEPDTDLSLLNHGLGVRGGVIRITDRAGNSAEVDLTNAQTPQDVLDALRGAGLNISATIVNSHFQITDTSSVSEATAGNLIIEDVTGHAAGDLGIAGDVEATAIIGKDVYGVSTLGDVIRAINSAADNPGIVQAGISADGDRITLSAFGIGTTVTVTDGDGATAASDLGLAGASFDSQTNYTSNRLQAGLNTVLLQSLNGGQGVALGTISLTDRAGSSTIGGIDLTSAQTLQDVIDLINADDQTGFTASVNSAGSGIVLRDASGGTGALSIEDVTGSAAADLGIAVPAGTYPAYTDNEVNSGSLQLQYISRQTNTEDLNGGRGLSAGTFTVTDAAGSIVSVNIAHMPTTTGALIDAINAAFTGAGADHLTARLNDSGDGLLIEDQSGGTGTLTIEDTNGGSLAADLRLAGEAKSGENFIDGSYEITIEVNATDTLNDVVKKLNNAGGDFSATVFNDGGQFNPYSLSLTSTRSGQAGELIISSTGVDLGFDTLTAAQDAVVSFGGQGGSGALLVTSSTNSLTEVVEGVTFDLLAVSDEPVTVTVSHDLDSVTDSVQAFVDAYNNAQDAIDQYTSFDTETYDQGPLFGDSTVQTIRDRMSSLFLRSYSDASPEVSRLFNIGLTVGSEYRLEFDAEKFQSAYEQDPEAVEQLFVEAESGFGSALDTALDDLTRDNDGLIARKDEALQQRQEDLNDRIDAMNVLLDAKRARLEAEFAALETALASLQDQQSALNNLASLLSSSSSG